MYPFFILPGVLFLTRLNLLLTIERIVILIYQIIFKDSLIYLPFTDISLLKLHVYIRFNQSLINNMGGLSNSFLTTR